MEERPARSSIAVWLLSAGLALVGVAITAVATSAFEQPATPAPWHVGALFAVLVAASYLLIRFRYRGEIDALDLFDAALAPIVLFLPAWMVVTLAAAAVISAEALRHNQPVKAVFNVSEWIAASAAGVFVFRWLADGPGLTANNLVALVLAMLVMTVVNHLAFTAVLALARWQHPVAILRGLGPFILRGWLGGWFANVAFGILFAGAFQTQPATAVLFLIPLALLHWSGRGFATAVADQSRLAALQRATHELGRHIDPRDGFVEFLTEVRDCFESETVELVLFEEGRRQRWRIDGDGVTLDGSAVLGDEVERDLVAVLARRGATRRVLPDDPDAELARLLRHEGWRDCIAAPLRIHDDIVGILRSCNRGGLEGFDAGELAVLDALAWEAAAALERGGLLGTILEERQTLSQIVGSTSDGIMTIESDGTVTTWNPGIESVTGYPATEMTGARRIPVLRARDTRGDDVFLERWTDDVELPTQVQVTTRDGEVRWLSCSYARVAGVGGRLPSLVVVARDVTRAYELDRLKDEFVATVSHELRTPLVPIKGFVTTLLQHGESLTPERRHEALESVLRSAQRLEHLVLNLLEVSRVDSSTSIPEPVPVAINDLADQLLDDLRQSWPERSITPSVPAGPTMALANPLWVEQVLMNLLANAIKYTPAHTPVELVVEAAAGETHVSVVDHGPGIPDHAVSRIFERWERLHLDDTQAGTGLGLYIARRLTDAMGGRITVSTTPGGGATFTLTLPATRHLAAVV